EIALARGLARVEIPFVPCGRNRPAQLFLEAIGAPLTAQAAAAVRYRVGEPAAPPAGGARAETEAPSKPAAARPDYVRIARELRTVEQIAERIRLGSRRPLPERALDDAPRTPLERDLAELWAGLLNLPAVGVHSNFFELGGHSLLAVQLLSRVR